MRSGLVPEVMTNITYVIRINDGEEESPAKRQGMKGEYFILEYGEWNIGISTSLFKKNIEIKGKPIVVMQDGIISKYHFDNIIGAYFDLKFVGQEEKQHIITMYKEWKKE